MQKPELVWYSVDHNPFVLEGFPFYKEEHVFRRLSMNPPYTLSNYVEPLTWHTSGGQLRFRGCFHKMVIRVRHKNDAKWDHMTCIAQSGFDLYLSPTGMPRYYGSTRFDPTLDRYEAVLAEFEEPHMLECVLNFPLYQGISELLIGFDADAVLEPPSPRLIDQPVIVYGTSITQGGCASRPGMSYTNILSRRLNVPFINLGFSNGGRCEPEAAYEIRRIKDCSLFIMDTEANTTELEAQQERYPEFIRIYREINPDTPFLVVSRVPVAKELRQPKIHEKRMATKKFQRELVEKLRAQGDQNIWFVDGEDLAPGSFEEYTVDGLHATDLGFYKIAQGFEPIIRSLLKL